jgi:hypothetical protein
MPRKQLVAAKEESTEMGGYFVCNGIERLIRLLVQTRRHYVMALRRGAYHKRGPNYTDVATLIRWGREARPAPRRHSELRLAEVLAAAAAAAAAATAAAAVSGGGDDTETAGGCIETPGGPAPSRGCRAHDE